MNNKEILKKLNESFGSYRAEWLKAKVFDLFAEPHYFTALQDHRPCILEGGRGTGKTTALRGLSYQGQYSIHNKSIDIFDHSNFIGIYHRVNTNHVRAFIGGNITEKEWERVFAHYFNLLICREILIFLKWHKNLQPEDEDLSAHACRLIGNCVNIDGDCDRLEVLLEKFDIEMYNFQSQINNIIDGNLPRLSMAGDAIKVVTEYATALNQFKDKTFFILLDEYENFEDYQQKIINTLLKHSSENYTFKIGVRELGWRVKHTLNPAELLHDPADYVLVNIEKKLTANDSTFPDFAKNVCQQRIAKLIEDGDNAIYDIERALKGISIEDEAKLLEVETSQQVKQFETLPKFYQKKVQSLPKLYLFFISFWSSNHKMDIRQGVDDWEQNMKDWDVRYENYKYEMLFKIRRGRGKSGIQKYYSGWSTYTKLANGNIRYLMELVYRAYEKHLMDDNGLDKEISPRNQTLAAQDTGQKNLMELEGLWKNGAQLTKLLLGLGRIFQVLARGEGRTAPEKNQFQIEKSGLSTEEFEELIRAGVMHLALVRYPGNKMGDDYNTRDYIYMIHPLYSAYFQYSHRRKRKIIFSPAEILDIINNPKTAIPQILQKSNIKPDSMGALPNQMNLFDVYFNEK
ncbi:ORC-CDC6 family AAA ATPase [Algoriphagus aquimarinus]|uniref:Uncharacterized protein n=1 Tax=Algoriphagus aquimarinus TaxID=237018 RepID=A0A1I1BK43_9BACT|nr:hypothetical protein [Algoriphagus aquimarinus]SFB50735.1 hypothetical protein SAMN04489723_114101 [Algoriphagus aquimarinus]